MIPVVSIVGTSNSGKTTFLEKLIVELKGRGYRLATIKHDVHGFAMDSPGKDTWRHYQAGADTVLISSPGGMAMVRRVDQEMELNELAAMIRDVDLILTEGYKRGPAPKIEVYRQGFSEQGCCDKTELLAVVSDTVLYPDIPHVHPDDAAGIADILIATLLTAKGNRDR